MANVQFSHNMGHVGFQKEPAAPPEPDVVKAKPLAKYTNIMGAVLSVCLVGALGVWGYKLIVRDVSGIPIVRATAGEMRIRPEDPGGQVALHQGLAVNEVAAEGEASGPVDRLVLAPQGADLAAEDQPVPVETAAPIQQPAPLDSAQIADAAEAGDLDSLVESLTAGAGTIEASPVAEADTASQSQDAQIIQAAVENAVIEATGLRLSKRPRLRPAVARPAEISRVTPTAASAPAAAQEIDAASIPVGTRLVQLGALDSPEAARAQWDRLNARFGAYLEGKDRVITKASSGGRSFYRLRAMGFVDLADARRFCAALAAEGADCIPVSTR